MRKTLAILLSVLIIFGCLPFGGVATAAEEGESLPTNMFSGYKSPGAKTITPSTNLTIGGSYAAGTAVALALQWGKADGSGNNSDPYSPINSGYYQLDFDVTVSDDINQGAVLYPQFHSQGSIYGMTDIVGVRYEKAAPGNMVTAHNYIKAASSSNLAKPSAAESATLKKGNYRYTYVFNSPKDQTVNYIAIMISGLTAGSVKIENANIFALAGTEWEEFYNKPTSLTRFMVLEEGNVFQRVYGYRAVNDTSTGSRRNLSAKLGGKYYDLYFKAGNTYKLNVDFRFPKGDVDISDVKYAPHYDFYETQTLDYTDEYEEIKASAGTSASDTKNYSVQKATKGTTQIEYADSSNGYSYYYAAAGQDTRSRRVNTSNIVNFKYLYNDETIYTAPAKTSSVGREAKAKLSGKNGWVNGEYSITAPKAQTVAEAYNAGKIAGSSSASATRYILSETDSTKWVYQSGYNSYFAPSEQNAYVALGIGYLYSGFVYDFDNIEIIGDFTEEESLPIKYVNIDGSENVNVLQGNSASYLKNDDTYIANVDFNSYGGNYAFMGWYEGENLVSSDTEFTFNVGEIDTSRLVAKILSFNVIDGDPGFENYSNEDTVRVEPANSNIAPYGDRWGIYNSHGNSQGSAGYENKDWPFNVKAFVGTINDSYNNYSLDPETNSTVASEAIKYTVYPYSGKVMMGAAVKSRSMVRKLQNLAPNTKYQLSFYVNNPSHWDFLKTVMVTDSYEMNCNAATISGVTIYASYNENSVDGVIIDNSKVRNWGKISLEFTTGANTENVYLHFGYTNKNTSTSATRVYIDELICKPILIGYAGNSIRAVTSELPQALRYKFYMNEDYVNSFIDMDVEEIGILAIGSDTLADKELVIGEKYNDKSPAVGIVKEENLVFNDDNAYFTAALYNIGVNSFGTDYAKYGQEYAVRPYIKLKSGDSSFIIYGSMAYASLFDVVKSICINSKNEADIKVARDILENEEAYEAYTNWEDRSGFFLTKDKVQDYDYSFAYVGDPQITTGYYPDEIIHTYNYIADNKEDKNIVYAVTLGDLTQNSTDAEYAAIEEGLKKVEAKGIYQSILRGNHDSVSSFDRNITKGEYGSYLSGTYDDTLKNTYHIFTAGNEKYMMLTLDYYPSSNVVDWAAALVEANPDCRVIVNTHGLLNYDMTLLTDTAVTYMHENLITKYENIVMAVCGHHEAAGPKYKIVTGKNSNKIVEMIIDPQGMELRDAQAYGLVAIFHFSNNGKTVEVEYYSTVKKAYYREDYQFVFELA